jgi:hypothetical protein
MADGVTGTTGDGNSSGVIGENTDGGNGVFGTSVSGNAVAGKSQSGNAGYFISQGAGSLYTESSGGDALSAVSHSVSDVAVRAINAAGGGCIYAESTAGNPATAAIFNKASGPAVFADSAANDGVAGISHYAPPDPSHLLDHAGVMAINSAGGAALIAKGDAHVVGKLTAVDVILAGSDCAEEFDVGSAGEMAPGTVVVFDANGAIEPSQYPYDKCVAGVVSGAGEYRPAVIMGRKHLEGKRVPVALVGRVYCKADATHGSIEMGDLLTTSPTFGHAMKAIDQGRSFGAVIGKALRPLTGGQALIPILIALQ